MGGSSSPPFLYDHPSKWSFNDPTSPSPPFNPKAVTQASQMPQPRRRQPEGPLVRFNRHPDTVSTKYSRAFVEWERNADMMIPVDHSSAEENNNPHESTYQNPGKQGEDSAVTAARRFLDWGSGCAVLRDLHQPH